MKSKKMGNKKKSVKNIDQWFEKFEKTLKEIHVNKLKNDMENDEFDESDDFDTEFSEFSELYHQWYDGFEKNDGFKEGAQVRYIGINDANDGHLKHPHYCGFPSDPRELLELDTIYEVEYRLLARSWQFVKLVGFKYDVRFSPSIFEVMDKNAEGKPLKVGGRVRYIGGEDDFLTYGNIYEVEGLLMHYHGFGFVSVKLIGVDKIYDRILFERVVN